MKPNTVLRHGKDAQAQRINALFKKNFAWLAADGARLVAGYKRMDKAPPLRLINAVAVSIAGAEQYQSTP